VVKSLYSFDHLSFHSPHFHEIFYCRKISHLRQRPKTKDFDLLDQRQNAPKRPESIRAACAGGPLGVPKWNSEGLKRSWMSGPSATSRVRRPLPRTGSLNQGREGRIYFLEPRLNEAASAADASRDTIWQGNCDVADLQSRSNIAPIRNTIPIQYPISNCPAKKGFLQTALSKARRTTVFRYTSFVDARFR
jgi:hypothetical protein